MNALSAAVILVCFVTLGDTADLMCGYKRRNLTILVSGQAENNVWAVGVTDIKLSVSISCTKYFDYDDAYYFYLLRSGEDVNSISYFSRIDFYWEFDFDTYNRFSTTKTIASFNGGYHLINVNISFLDHTLLGNQPKLAIKDARGNLYIHEHPFVLKYCPVLPSNLHSNYNSSISFKHGDVISLFCLENLFVKDVYHHGSAVNATCYLNVTYPTWKMSNYECAAGCTNPARRLIKTYPTLLTTKYKANTRLGVFCSNGRVFSSGQPNVFIQSIVCRSNGEWDHVYIDCWQDQIVDFKSSKLTLSSGINTVFACEAKDRTHRVKITVGEDTFQSRYAIWWVAAPGSQWNGIIAICEVIDDNKIVIEKLSTFLNVLYAPEFLHDDKNLQFGLDKDMSGHAIIEFNANPALSLIDVKITKNGTQIQNYYMTVKDFSHKVVVDFTEVRTADFGEYVLSMTSVSPVAKVTKANFTIFQSIAEQQGFTAVHAAVSAIGSILIIALVIVAIFIARRMMNKQETSNATVVKETLDAVVYDATVPEHHNYEDIEGKRGDEATGSGGKDGYVDMEIGQPPQQNTYTDERNRTTQPSPNNANQKVALKPPTRQNRVDQENPYMMPSVARWR